MKHAHLLRLSVRGEPDVFLLRQRGREVAAAVGLDAQDQIRVATVLSDLGRNLLGDGTRIQVEFALVMDPGASLRIQLRWQGGCPVPRGKDGWVSATRLMTEVRADDGGGDHGEQRVVSLLKRFPAAAPPLTREHVAALRAGLARLTRGSILDELRAQNEELLVTLETLERQQSELMRLNAELEETNRGVMALYGELSNELEETNRGVVALYAELDEKSIQLKEAGESKSRFWSNMSHELRTPINSIIGLVRLLLAADADPLTEEQRHQIQMINNSGATLLGLVNDLLDAAKAESGRLRPQPAAVDLKALFGQLRGTMRPIAPIGDVTLVIEDPPAGPGLVTDETMLSIILRNLLSNGLKFTQRGEVRLSVRHDGAAGCWEFLVADTGIGIPEDQQKRVFEEFHQVPNPLQARTSGTGLGLPHARRLAELLDGVLELRSTPGTGTKVFLRLPATDADSGPPNHWGRVLLADDDEVFRAGFRDLIGDLATTWHEVADGHSALRAAKADPPDLIILDLNMPGLDGYDCLAALRAEPALVHVPVVVMTCADAVGIDNAALGPAVPVLHKSRLSRAVVQYGVQRARQLACGQGES